jgi:hypothetical protein
MPSTLTLTYACGHTTEIDNDTGAESRIQFMRQFNCLRCKIKTGKLRPSEGDPTQHYSGPAYRPETPTLRPLLCPDYLTPITDRKKLN